MLLPTSQCYLGDIRTAERTEVSSPVIHRECINRTTSSDRPRGVDMSSDPAIERQTFCTTDNP